MPDTVVSKKKIVIVDDDQNTRDLLSMFLSENGYCVTAYATGYGFLKKIREEMPDIIIMDIMMPDITGIELKKILNADEVLAPIPVVYLTGRDDISDKEMGFSLGVVDYITKPFDLREFLARLSSIIARHELYDKIAMVDTLTGLFNANYFRKEISQLFNVARRYGNVFSLVIFDVDNMKTINDNYSHYAGDMTLKKLADVLKHNTRESDIVTRYGGDEFIVIMPETDVKDAGCAVKRIREAIASNYVTLDDKAIDIPLRVSIGFSTYNKGLLNAKDLFEKADANMYKEKKQKMLTDVKTSENLTI
ncbi:MAG TPA: diguanylate cyclase [Candidatus Omnitrophota bacterium]|nr:diguanylate cyclase [Candidatus Omnitrophota bacterium]HPS20925.1 diguanylate cyclase [Candidatus Omnitrophota bacterium]